MLPGDRCESRGSCYTWRKTYRLYWYRLLERAKGHENVGFQTAGGVSAVLESKDPAIKEVLRSCLRTFIVVLIQNLAHQDILRLIEQYLSDEGYVSTKLVLHDEANLKGKERDERAADSKRLKRAILGKILITSARRRRTTDGIAGRWRMGRS